MFKITYNSAADRSHFFKSTQFLVRFVSLLLILSSCRTEGLVEFNNSPSSLNIQESDNFISLENTVSSFTWKVVETKEGKFTQLVLDQYNVKGKKGTPGIPSLNKLIKSKRQLSLTAFIDSNQLETSQYNIGKYPILPIQPNGSKPEDAETIVIDHDSYSTDKWITNNLIQLEKLGKMKGEYTYRLRINPIRYNPVSNEIEVVTTLYAKLNRL